ncbi:MAG: hypothetical protein ACR2KK_13210, partial [Acidimicrobiales bacterium]
MTARMRWALAGLVALILTLGIVTVSLRGISPLRLAPQFSVGLLFVVAGVVAAGRRRDSVTGRLLIATGLAWLLSQALVFVPNGLAATIGVALLPLGLAFLGHLALAFPDGLTSRTERIIVALPYVLVGVGVPVMDLGDCEDCARNVVGLDIGRGLGRAW